MRRICQLTQRDFNAARAGADPFKRYGLLGFDAVSYRPNHFDLFDEHIEYPRIISAAGAHGLSLALDLRIDIFHRTAPTVGFETLSTSRSRYLDPRKAPSGALFVPLDFGEWELGTDAPSRRWLDLLANRLTQLVAAGLGGFRCLEVVQPHLAAWRTLIKTTRERNAQARFEFIAETPEFFGDGNPGFDAFIVPVEFLSRPEFQPPVAGRLPLIAVPSSSARVRGSALLQSSIKLCVGLSDGVFLPVSERSASVGDNNHRLDDLGLPSINAFLNGREEAVELGTRRPTVRDPSLTVVTRYFRHQDSGERSVLASMINNSRELRSVDLTSFSNQFGQFLPLRNPFDTNSAPHALIVSLGAEQSQVLAGFESAPIAGSTESRSYGAEDAVSAPRLIIENVEPVIGGDYPAKRTVGESVHVEADAFGEGHDRIAVALKWRAEDESQWRETRMASRGNDRWSAEFPLLRLGRHYFTIEAWRDEFAIYHDQLAKKRDAGVAAPVDIEEGRILVARLCEAAQRKDVAGALSGFRQRLLQAEGNEAAAILLDPALLDLAAQAGPRPYKTALEHEATVDAETPLAGFASWYELFPRSQSGDASRHGTFDDVVRRLPQISAMGFDVVYLPPIHPIGTTNRKGRNNSLNAGQDDPGSPYAIGSALGGHDAIHPELGDVAAFSRLIEAARELHMEVALDLAIQASPDHPWLREHPEWFDWRPDGSIRYAENPPKKYEDIVNVDFYAPGAKPALWIELRDIVLLWVGRGVRFFRVDNPHTKPFPFWEWLINEVRRDHPDVVFLSEAFTRPKVMNRLAKIGFSQSYTYFTWRNTKYELTQYMKELLTPPIPEFFRPHFFVNTHDINPDFLQNAPRSAYLIRLALATTLSGLWGMYNGFELCEGRPDEKKKEYADSEKYQLTAWDWNRPGNIVAEITALNSLRRQNPALQSHLGLEFHTAWNENVLYYEKATRSRDNVLLVAVSLDPYGVQEADIEVPLWKFGLPDHESIAVEDLMRGVRFDWTGKMHRIRLDPAEMPFSIWRLTSRGHTI